MSFMFSVCFFFLFCFVMFFVVFYFVLFFLRKMSFVSLCFRIVSYSIKYFCFVFPTVLFYFILFCFDSFLNLFVFLHDILFNSVFVLFHRASQYCITILLIF